ncbi:LPS-assembly protein LptD [Acinetobacter gyllenbergii]|uniref:LPS-assembly protein LptD n=1 Tax=Acinetobacter gyllenbergii CIP 110306 = MTCC 11365 TaxID=1217657 RepID=A0A829HJW8_9GAMM|nr:LPS assembly protein LptD [Acinetobacter gyllenbergii]EPF83470.1 LPS-assembly protein lptD [Acinetobacter gyllenbergii CIP 110306 = MTCC 11365]EPH35545.1 Outer membrane protein Imp [Acinetobacter gyllenbergii CIP 110306 = MTCC 11365]ESK57722.1 LPS-assembly protein lptD [Acinetobacter gyllenbergii NIPH 230]OBY75436.1 LPS biosynthesis protein [Acinetobacter gyllenbergii]GMA12114.1 LPS-assembly protein LptD [Acinetobacter gyllenbergii]
MKHQFKFNPLATAILTLLCGGSIQSSFAAPADAVSTLDNKQLKAAIRQNQEQQNQESYPGESFFQQYYVDKSAPEAQLRDNRYLSSSFCQGTWVTPINPETKAGTADTTTSVLTADYGHYNPAGDSVLQGNVVIDQEGRTIRADQVTIDSTQTYANAEGRVQVAQSGLLTQSDTINYNLKTQTGDLNNSFYISEQQHAHGHASQIKRANQNLVVLKDASYTACPPEQKPAWKIQAKEIELNQDTGRGVTRGTKLYVKNVPVLAVPYFNFPIDDRRTTGLLSPNFGYSNDGGAQLITPIYLNLAPNYDLTLTPSYMSKRGPKLDADFRYMTENFGSGRIWGGYIAKDNQYGDEARDDLHFVHNWKIDNQWSTNLEYNYASDKDYFADFNNNPNTRTDLNLRRAWELNYQNGIPGLRAQLKVEDFQTLDKTIKDVDKPYARLPQFLLNYITGDPQGLQYEFNNDTAYFKKSVNDGSALESSGTRIYNQFAVRYNYLTPSWFYVVPEVSVRSINTFYDQDSKEGRGLSASDDLEKSVVVPQFTLSTGLTFEKDGKYLQSISPRAFYAYSPYKNQDDHPNFDSTTASINYDQLFNPYRFYGHDRLDDNNFLSLGVTYSLLDTEGLERIKASIGQSYYFSDRRVSLNEKLDEFDTQRRTGPIVSLSSQLNQNFTITSNSAWMSNGENAQRDFQAYYTGDKGNLYNLGYFYRKHIPDRQDSYDQVVASFIQPVKDNWRIMGHAQYDIDNNVMREYLLGVNYESCCWAVSVYGRSYYNDLDDPNSPDVRKKNAVMAEFTLKGLGALNNKLASLLENRVLGFNKINQSWTQR